MTTDDIDVQYHEDFDVWKNNYAFSRCTGGESTFEVYERVVAATVELGRLHDGQNVLISTHATPIRALTAYSQGLPKERVGEVPFPCNASINIFTFENGILCAERTNITEHLGDIIKGVHRSFGK
jgi:probable phosphoglycerate mutase